MSERIPAEVFPPGDLIREEIEARGWTQADLAEILDRPPRLVSELLSGKKTITPETAQGLGEAFGVGAQFWLNMETAYRLHVYRNKSKNAGVVSRKAKLFEDAPIRDMLKRGWIEPSDNIDVLEKQVGEFFGTPLSAAARKSTSYGETTNAQKAWLHRARQLASGISATKYSKKTLMSGIGKLRSLMIAPEEVRHVPRVLARLGVKFLIVEHLPHTKIDGACLWVDKSPVIALSVRYDRIDSFWYTLGHELAHVIYQDALSIDVDLAADGSRENKPDTEVKADNYGANFCIPQDELDDFIARVDPLYLKKIDGFASRMGVHPGLVVGQLHFKGKIPYSSRRETLVKVRDILTQSSFVDGWGQVAPV